MTRGRSKSLKRVALSRRIRIVGKAPSRMPLAFFRLTADLKYHDFQRGEERIILADAGHYETEQFAKEIISRTISEKFCNFACRISERQKSIVQYI